MKRKVDTSEDLPWADAVHDIPESGLVRTREASPEELTAIARTLDLVACAGLKAIYSIKPMLDGRYSLSGTVYADISQTCVVTLDPVESSIEEHFEATFWPEQSMPAPRGGEVDLDDEPDPEPIVAGQLAVGRAVFECLAATIDPFPRKPGAILDWNGDAAEGVATSARDSPFAVLANIKPKA
jgi:uncharacterized protein